MRFLMDKDKIISLLDGAADDWLFGEALRLRNETIGDKVYLRGLIELSNRCRKNCFYCGIRCDNHNVERYELTKEQVVTAAKYALEHGYGSVVLQAGEQQSNRFTDFVTDLLSEIKELSQGKLGITLSLGEQSEATYEKWFAAGAHRYLLRIESSSEDVYKRIHPEDHSFTTRLGCLSSLKEIGYQVGTGVMIGLPEQTTESLADDLLFLKNFDVDMCGMGPYIEHPDAPLGKSQTPLEERFRLALRMISLLRLLMPTINIASTTALQAINPLGREMGIAAGANIIMPNITPSFLRANYKLYNNKPLSDIDLSGFDVAYNEWGDSRHYALRSN